MFRPATRLLARPTTLRSVSRAATTPARRFLSTAPPSQKSRSWKSLVGRLGIAGTIIYYYNTTDVFAEEPRGAVHALPTTEDESATLPTIEDVARERSQRKAAAAAEAQADADAAVALQAESGTGAQDMAEGGVEQLEADAGQQGAFNPETGEINWDCPCLGGMASGPCGEEFKAAFSCFVFSTEEPKGMDCIEKFKGMQNCFREYPEIYGAELSGDEDDEDVSFENAPAEAAAPAQLVTETSSESSIPTNATSAAEKVNPKQDHGLVPDSYRPAPSSSSDDSVAARTQRATDATQQVKRDEDREPLSETEKLVPRAAHNATDAMPGQSK